MISLKLLKRQEEKKGNTMENTVNTKESNS